MNIQIVRQKTFSAAQRYFDPKVSVEENRRTYGSLYRDEGFGFNFRIEAAFEGQVDPLTGMIANLVDIDQWMTEVLVGWDHKDLNVVMKNEAPTLERITVQLFKELQAKTTGAKLVRVRVYEGDRKFADCEA